MAVNDNWGEVLRKSAEEVTPGSKAEYYLKVKDSSTVTTEGLIMAANDRLETYTYLDVNSQKLKRIDTITYSSASVSPTAQVVDTFNYTLQAGVYNLTSIQRSFNP